MLKRLDFELFDQVWKEAVASPRHRMHYDLRDSVEEESQRMLNVLEPDTVIPIHRHSDCPAVVVPQGVYHTAVCLEPGSVILEIKAKKYDPVLTEVFLVLP